MAMPMNVRLREADIQEVMALFKRYRLTYGINAACKKVEEKTEVPWQTVYTIQRRFRPTTALAEDHLKASALKLAMRVVRKANVEQAIGILSRPNIGVLASDSGGGDGGGRSFMIGVAVDGLGSVKVGMQVGGSQASSLPQAEEAPEQPLLEGEAPDHEDEDEDEEVRPIRKWYLKDKRPLPPPPVPAIEGRVMGQSMPLRLAQAKAERKEAAKIRKRDKKRVDQRMKELGEQLKKNRE